MQNGFNYRAPIILFCMILGICAALSGSTWPDEKPQRVTVGGKEMAKRLKVKVPPVYPEEARRNKIQGVVKLHVIVGTEGTMQQIQVVSGHPLLARAALDAVRQWTYEPFTVNNRPVEVDTEVDVIFQLAGVVESESRQIC